MKTLKLTSIFFCLCVGLLVSAPAYTIDFGLRSQVWPFMWAHNQELKDNKKLNAAQRTQWAVAEDNLRRFTDTGASWNYVNVWPSIDGPDKFRRLEKIYEVHQRNGIQVCLRLLESPATYESMTDKWSEDYGYSRQYFDWVASVLKQFDGRIRYLMISNEADHNLSFNQPVNGKSLRVTPEQYFRLLKTAALAIEKTTPDVEFMDHGISSYTLSLAVLNSIVEKQGIDAGLEYWKSMQYNDGDTKNTLGLLRLLNRKNTKHRVAWVEEYFSYPPIADYFQLHHYFGDRALAGIFDWLSTKWATGGKIPKVIVGEYGYRMPSKRGEAWDGRPRNIADWARYDQEDHAISNIRTSMTMLEYGVHDLVMFQMRFQNDKDPTATLYKSGPKPEIFEPYRAGTAFKYMAQSLRDKVLATGVQADASSALEQVNFESPTETLRVYWSRDPAQVTSISLPGASRIEDIYGDPVKSQGKDTFVVGRSPIYAYWNKSPAASPGQ